MNPSRLAPGVSLVAVPGQGLAVRTADGEFLRVGTGDVPESALWERLGGAAGEDASDGELDALVGAFERAGYLRPQEDPATPSGPLSVLLVGAPALTGPLAALLVDSGTRVRTGTADEIAGAVAGEVVVWCLDGPVPRGSWDEADRLPARGVGWLRCHREGHQLWIEPLALTARDVTSAHVRARRLAATPAHRELAAYWEGGDRRIDGEAQLPPAGAALAAALLAADLDAHAHGSPRTRRLRRVDLRDLSVTEHVVLPVPDVAPMPDTLPAPRTTPQPERTTA
ncbi:hypothetical protein [Streptomyces sp. Da 82-17]|uniref:hypothetical protein n=1 Tax=Streptomyces sp. Da 82-17 TaxID=3377116 RepID=UPI0038D454F4